MGPQWVPGGDWVGGGGPIVKLETLNRAAGNGPNPQPVSVKLER